MRDVVICEPVRTAVGGFGGSFKEVHAHVLGAAVVAGLMERTGLPKDKVDDVIFAQCYPSMDAPALGRVVALDAGLPVEGVNLPGHFLARYDNILFDPFHQGKILTRRDCEEILRRQNQRLEDWHLASASPRQILARILANLLYVYHRQGNSAQYARLKRWSHLLVRG